MLESLYPDEIIKSAYDVDYSKLYHDGYRGIIYDIDNTLVPHGAPADNRAICLIKDLQNLGFKVCLVSNNDRERVDMFNKDVHVFVVDKAIKPSRKGYIRAMAAMGTDKSNTVSIGDQIFTDVWGARRTGIHSILVGQIAKGEEIQIVFKRSLEKVVLFFYYRKINKKQEG